MDIYLYEMMISRNFLVLPLLLITSLVLGQKIKKYVKTNYSEIKSIAPGSTDFWDLEALGNAIGGARIVMLGEQDHGDAPTFLAKSRIIKYLREKKGFKVLAFESDFFAMNRGWDKFEKKTSNIQSFIRANMPAIWTKCKQCEELLYTYLPGTYPADPLRLTGFDNSLLGWYSKLHLGSFIDSYLKSKKIAFTKTDSYHDDFRPYLDSLLTGTNLDRHEKFGKALIEITRQVKVSEDTGFEMMVLKNMQAGNSMAISRLLQTKDLHSVRDKQMADNLQWLVKVKYPTEKIIVWAANSHILKNPEAIRGNSNLLQPMGNFFVQDKELLSETYILGFNSRAGTAGRIGGRGIYPIKTPESESFEHYFPERVPYAFVDFKKFREQYPDQHPYFNMKGIGHSLYNAKWTQCFDGIFYIRDMYPCDLLNR